VVAAEQLAFDLIARDINASRTFNKVGDAADDAGDSIKGMGRDSEHLGRQISDTENHLKALVREFDRTGDKELFKQIRKDRSTLSFLRSIRKEIVDLGKDTEKVGAKAGKQLTGGFGDALQALPAQVRGSAMLAIAGIGVAMSPVLGAMLSAAVVGGVGTGGIIGGIALASQDARVQDAAKGVGQRFMAGLSAEAGVFVAPVVDALGILESAGREATATLGNGFRRLAPLITPLAHGIEGLVREVGPGLSAAFEAAEPAIRAIAHELPEVGAAISDALKSISGESDSATEGMLTLFHVLETGIRVTGDIVGVLSAIFHWLIKVEGAALEIGSSLPPILGPFSALLDLGAKGAGELAGELNDAKDSTHDFSGSLGGLSAKLGDTAQASRDAHDALVDLAKSIEDQFDPTANLIHKLQDVKTAQKDYNEAVKDHGTKSREAREAELNLASAILAANGAAAAAQGTFDGKLSPALRKILHDGGLTAAQINDIETQFRQAKAAGDAFSKTYKAQLVLNTSAFFGSLAAANNALNGGTYVSGRASGGPVASGKTYMVGENGPELVTFGADGYVHNERDTRAMLSGTSGGSATPAAAAPALTPEALGRAVRSALQGMTVTMDGRRVGELTGRQADIYRRTTP
jgi:hypothetical protein